MEYSNVSLGRLRDRLQRYRAQGINGRQRNWYRIAKEIAGITGLAVDEDDPERTYISFGESLRRFVAGSQTPTSERLDAIAGFLVKIQLLIKGELEGIETPIPGGREQTPWSLIDDDVQKSIQGAFIGERRRAGGRNQYELLTIYSDASGTLKTEQITHLTSLRAQSTSPENLNRFFKVASQSVDRADGWIVAASATQLVIYQQDRLTKRSVILSVIHAERGQGGADHAHALHVLEHGRFQHPDDGLAIPVFGKRDNETNTGSLLSSWFSDNIWHYVRQGERLP